MATDRHEGRTVASFSVTANPESFNRLIINHGIYARLMRGRVCPNALDRGAHDMYCKVCGGDGYVYDFQRKLLQVEEMNDTISRIDPMVVRPFRIPVYEPLKAEYFLPKFQGGITRYDFESFTDTEIRLKLRKPTDKKPVYHDKIKLSYYFDRYNKVVGEMAEVNEEKKILRLHGPILEEESKASNWVRATGDITTVEEVKNLETGEIITNYEFRKNYIFVNSGTVTKGKMRVSYHYAPVEKILVGDVNGRMLSSEKWERLMASGTIRVSIPGWFSFTRGDLITLLTPQFYRDEVIQHSDTDDDKLMEFEIGEVEDVIFDDAGNKYRKGIDFILVPYNRIMWIGTRPSTGAKISVRYGYHPTYALFEDQPQPNTLDNKIFPTTAMVSLFNRTNLRELTQDKKPQENTAQISGESRTFWNDPQH